jgi:hypothetical protein
MNGCLYVGKYICVHSECKCVEVCGYKFGCMYSIYVHMSLCINVYACNIVMHVYTV